MSVELQVVYTPTSPRVNPQPCGRERCSWHSGHWRQQCGHGPPAPDADSGLPPDSDASSNFSNSEKTKRQILCAMKRNSLSEVHFRPIGGLNMSLADQSVHLPTMVSDLPGRIQVFIVATPFLLGRPLMARSTTRTTLCLHKADHGIQPEGTPWGNISSHYSQRTTPGASMKSSMI